MNCFRLSQMRHAHCYCRRVTVFLVDSTKGELWAVAKEKDFEGTRLAIGVGIAGTVAQTGRTINVADAYDDERFDRSNDVTRGFRTRSVLCCAVPGFTSSGVSQGGDDAVHQPIAVVQAINKIGPVVTAVLWFPWVRQPMPMHTARVSTRLMRSACCNAGGIFDAQEDNCGGISLSS